MTRKRIIEYVGEMTHLTFEEKKEHLLFNYDMDLTQNVIDYLFDIHLDVTTAAQLDYQVSVDNGIIFDEENAIYE